MDEHQCSTNIKKKQEGAANLILTLPLSLT